MKDPDLQKELETLKRKSSIPAGEALKQMLSTEEGRKRYSDRKKKWDRFKKKWNIVFFIKDRPVFRSKDKPGRAPRKSRTEE